jgi:ribonuclease-3
MNAERAPDDLDADWADALGYAFVDPALLEQALTHRSALDRRPERRARFPHGNERLEFLGDRVLSLVVADMLMSRHPGEDEGALARRHSTLVSTQALAAIAARLDLGPRLRLGDSELMSRGQEKPSILADACEALIGAIYSDGGLEPARAFVERTWEPLLSVDLRPPRDPKTELQEWAQGRGLALPAYREVGREGPAHAPAFVIEASVKGAAPVRGRGASKREAERAAALALLEVLRGPS